MKGKKFLYDKTNFDWSRKFMGGYTGDPVRRINDGHSEHSHLSNYENIYELNETPDYKLGDMVLDKIIFDIGTDDYKISILEKIYNCKLPLLHEIKKYLVEDGGAEEFIKNEGRELYKKIILEEYPKLGIKTRKLTQEEVDRINEEKLKYIKEKKKKENQDSLDELLKIQKEMRKKIINQNIYIPKDFQNEILIATIKYYLNNNIGQVILPCGTGKTVIGTHIGKNLKSDKILIGVPGNLLISQWEDKILDILPEHKILCITSSKKPINNNYIYTTKDDDIINFIERNNKYVIISTYQSCNKLISYNFNFKIGDECHHLSGENKTENGYKCFHTIYSDKTLYLTATKRNIDKLSNGENIYSMDNTEQFGNIIYEQNLRWAIDKGLVTDYNLIALKNNEEDICSIMRNCNIKEDNIELFLGSYMSLKSLIKYDNLSHIFVYANSKKNSDKIIEYMDKILDSNMLDISKEELYYKSLHSESKCDINKEISDFKEKKYGVISCVYMFGEGFDLPKLNGVVFAENMQSEIRIVQSTTRCFRLYPESPDKIAHVIIPYLDKDNWNDDNESFKKLRKIVFELRNEDKNIEQNIKLHTVKSEKDYSLESVFKKWKYQVFKNKNDDDSCFDDDDDDENNLNKLRLRLRKAKSLKSNYESELHEYYDYMKERNKNLNISSKSEYIASFSESDYLENPHKYFKLTWTGWYDFLGVNTKNFIQMKDEWIKFCKEKNVKSVDNYNKLCMEYHQLPREPSELYLGFTSICNELGLFSRRR